MLRMAVRLALVFYMTLASAVSSQEPLVDVKPQYKLGERIPVSCLNRTAEGEHVTTSSGQLQYIPFPTCNETSRPLELSFGMEKDVNCTLEVTDPFYHLLEYYVHNDSPFTCRIPARPSASLDAPAPEGQGSLADDTFVPLIIALTGTLQLSHLHVSTHLNMLVHAAPRASDPGVVAAATAYSVATAALPATKIIIGDSLPLRFSVRWYPDTKLPSGWTGMGGHVYTSTVVYCLFSAMGTAAACFAYFRGWELPRRLKSHGRERTGAVESGGNGRLGSYGYGVGGGGAAYGGYGYGVGKRD